MVGRKAIAVDTQDEATAGWVHAGSASVPCSVLVDRVRKDLHRVRERSGCGAVARTVEAHSG